MATPSISFASARPPSRLSSREAASFTAPLTSDLRPLMMKLTDKTVADLLAAFQSSDPTPGGGSAAALAGAIGASLLAMVAGLPKSRAATEEDAERLEAAAARCRELAAHLSDMVDRD